MIYTEGKQFVYAGKIWTVIEIEKKEVVLEDINGSHIYIDLNSKDPMPEDFKELIK